MHLIDSTERLERAYDDWKNGIWSQDPYIDMLIPSLTDPTMTPPRQALHVGLRTVRATAGEGQGMD